MTAVARSALSRISSLLTPSPRPAEQRAAPRRQAALTAEVVCCGQVHSASITNISVSGLTLRFANTPPSFKGAQLLVRAPGFAPITGSVRWTLGNECGLAFNVALAGDLLENEAALFDKGKRPRPGRARITLCALVRAPSVERKVLIENIGSGGAQVCSAMTMPLAVGSGAMLEIEGLMPIGVYVRWRRELQYGLMFSKLLPITAAEYIAERCAIHPSWLAEVQTAHAALAS